ncbi:MAG: hypothetical protein CL868_06330 [Cytophagaceae bacterium]|nr:hypothetical protein [Cytophagaceae bacterium]|tara:strand:+ start:2810 stop:3184 length:375 start_codon:yes stop_codon:yes gene_type:complete
MRDYLENKYAEFWIEAEILFCIYKSGTHLDLDAAKIVVKDRLMAQLDIAYPVYCDIRGIQNSEKEARDYLAREGSVLARAIAYHVHPPVSEGMLNFYLRRSRPTVPTQSFTSKEQALSFLAPYV